MTSLRRVLHVEDDPSIREVVSVALGVVGELEVMSCASGHEALDQAVAWCPDLMLLDVMMPELDGPALLARLRDDPRTDRIPVVFMTARVQPAELAHYRSLGALDVVIKPFDPLTLAGQIRHIWETRHE
ncbi:Response regulator receiver domain-containing protein [Modicisalibacter ilicicola DSM 19980]|uniref:Response regulator receiver domain-containing protein n=1 Tax=Modicisalibacter ilicicola DSM 19980 TaxID=1121942 RepID=A0A1M4TA55_9GAMM|nr:response regulator [Halomonas ilicicola]SHE41386.1 Response regulator receiver domain-containing protein [Halomonas ilicicola DSM 19980]